MQQVVRHRRIEGERNCVVRGNFPSSPRRSDNVDHFTRNRVHDTCDIKCCRTCAELTCHGFRSGFINQVEYLARQSKFPCWYSQTNRNLGKFAQHSNGILSRFRPFEVSEHKLPGMIPGRGALLMRFGSSEMSLDVVIVHLALGQRTRMRQLDYVGELLGDSRHAIVMGDFNCRSHSVEIERLCARGDLCEPLHDLHTFPSWRPQANIDHILISPSLTVEHAEVLDHPLSDHLPVVMRVGLPEHLKLLPWPHLAAAV